MSEKGGATIRQEMLRTRRTMDPEFVRQASERTVARWIRTVEAYAVPEFWQGKAFALYRGLPGELDLRPLEEALHTQGSRLFFPRVADRALKQLEFVEALQNCPWAEGPYGIQEPSGGERLDSASALSAVFVPGTAFGMNGERIGMGAGYYDRWLATHSTTIEERPLRIALAMDYQIFEKLEQNAWDLPVDWVFTEGREYRGPAVQHWLASAGRISG